MTNFEIRENYLRVVDQINQAAVLVHRDPADIHLVVVTKTHSIDIVQAVIEAGATDLGENYVEEALPKIGHFDQGKDLRWHMIGHVQSRKAQDVCVYFHFLHSLDSLKLARRLSRFAVEMDKTMPVFLELNVSGESLKSGWDISLDVNWENIMPDIVQIVELPRINIIGLMTIPPYAAEPENSRPYYRKLKEFQHFVVERFRLTNCIELSMGMSGDFVVAIQEGATYLRIGQAILGPRQER